MLRKPLAFLKKDLLVESSYYFPMAFNFLNVLFGLLVYFFIDKLFGRRITPGLQEFGVDYFSYVLLGMAFFGSIGAGIGSFSERIRSEQVEGTLETILLTPTPIHVVLYSMALWNALIAIITMAVYAALGILVFHVNFANINIPSAFVVTLLTIVSFGALDILAASFIIVFKRGNPVGWIMQGIEGLLGGVYFPVTVMPAFLQILAKFIPITYSVRAIQLAIYKNYSIGQLSGEIIPLIAFCAVLVPLSLSVFKYALKKARREGSLAQH